jgi:hypothetical protein
MLHTSKYYFFLLILLQTTITLAQKTDGKVVVNTVVGSFENRSELIRLNTYEFNAPIEKYYIDTTLHCATVQTRFRKKEVKGELIYYNLANQKTSWVKPFNYLYETLLRQDSVILLRSYFKTLRIEPSSGKKKWEKDQIINRVHKKNAIGLSMAYYDGEIKGVNLTNGEVIWTKKIEVFNDYFQQYNINDSLMLLSASGIYLININTGKGWSYKLTNESALLNKLGLFSNIIFNKGRDSITNIYIASQKSINYFTQNDSVPVWSRPINSKFTSQSQLTLRNNKLYLVNLGYVVTVEQNLARKTHIKRKGIPYFSAYNSVTGEQLFNRVINKSEGVIKQTSYKNNTLYTISSKQDINSYNLSDGSLENKIELNKKYNYKFIRNDLFVSTEDNTYKPLNSIDTTTINLLQNDTSIIELNKNLNVINSTSHKQFWLKYATSASSKYSFLANKNTTIIINERGQKIAQFTVGVSPQLIDKKLYSTINNKLIEMDLTELLTAK